MKKKVISILLVGIFLLTALSSLSAVSSKEIISRNKVANSSNSDTKWFYVTVLDVNGNSVKGAKVTLYSVGGKSRHSDYTNQMGEVSFWRYLYLPDLIVKIEAKVGFNKISDIHGDDDFEQKETDRVDIILQFNKESKSVQYGIIDSLLNNRLEMFPFLIKVFDSNFVPN